MPRSDLAKKLVAAKSAAERKRLLSANAKLADEKLALKIKDICYAAWTSEPTIAQKAASALKSLYAFNRTQPVQAYFLWLSGIADLSRGRLESAIGNLNAAGTIFREIGREHESGQARVATLIALALLGRYDEAIETGEEIISVLDKFSDDVAAGRTEMNLGNIVSRRELHLQAEKYYLSARRRFIRVGDKNSQLMAENGLAITYSQLNDFRKAGKVFTRALDIARDENMLLTCAELEASIGNLALFRGRYDEALKFLELSRRKYEQLNMPHQNAVAGLEIADIYRELNLTHEAFDIYEDVSETFKRLKLQGEEARARLNCGRTAILLGEPRRARRELKRSVLLYKKEKNRTGAAAAKLVQARLEIESGFPKRALGIIDEAELLLNENSSFRHLLGLRVLKAEALGKTGDPMAAVDLLSQTWKQIDRREYPDIALGVMNLLGRLTFKLGRSRRSRGYFKKAINLIEELREPLAAEEFRMSFFANKLEAFETLADICLSERKIDEAFLYVERARSRSLAETIEDDLLEPTGPNIPVEFSAKLTQLREELNWYYSRLQRAGDEETGSLQKEASAREKEIAALMRRIESTRQGKVRARSIDISKLRKQLGTRSALVEFVNFDGVFSAFIVDDKNIRFVRGLATSDEVLSLLEGLQFQFGALRYGAKFPAQFAAELKKRADRYLEMLFEKLVRPLAAEFGDRDLVIAPSGALNYVPFHALRDRGHYLIESRGVVNSPSAAVWLALREKPHIDVKNSLLMGYADEKIPLVDREIDLLANLLPNAKTFTGESASFAAYTGNASEFDLLHLACHGQFRPDNPMFSSLHLADGWVTVRDICRQRIHASLVTLSACETGLNRIFAGDEIIGLARGFLSAGATSLVLSLWTVNDEAAAQLMHIFYENLHRGNSIAASLRIAQCEFIKRGAHPYFWSPFVLIGK